jgi:hypothetical protein
MFDGFPRICPGGKPRMLFDPAFLIGAADNVLERHDKPEVPVHVLFILVARHHDGKSFADALRSTDHLISQI